MLSQEPHSLVSAHSVNNSNYFLEKCQLLWVHPLVSFCALAYHAFKKWAWHFI